MANQCSHTWSFFIKDCIDDIVVDFCIGLFVDVLNVDDVLFVRWLLRCLGRLDANGNDFG